MEPGLRTDLLEWTGLTSARKTEATRRGRRVSIESRKDAESGEGAASLLIRIGGLKQIERVAELECAGLGFVDEVHSEKDCGGVGLAAAEGGEGF